MLRRQVLASFVAAGLYLAAPEAIAIPRGRPTVKLDQLEMPEDLPNAWYFKKRLRRLLKKLVRRVDWGAGRDSTIEYRFFVRKLTLEKDGDVLRVHCAAVGRLPHGKSAKSRLSFSGAARQQNAVVERVLEIVARGVVTRLAELERERRGQVNGTRHVRAPFTDQ